MSGCSLTRALTGSQWQVVLLALAELSLRRPGWAPLVIEPLADALGGRMQYEAYRVTSSDLVAPPRGADL